MSVPVLPESAPFSPAQRAWLNGFFAGVLSLDVPAASGASAGSSSPVDSVSHADGQGLIPPPAPEPEEEFPWHDPTLPIEERLELAADQRIELRLMAAMAQLDCGTCGYTCRTYAAAIAGGGENVLTKCTPGGKATAKKVKELMAGAM